VYEHCNVPDEYDGEDDDDDAGICNADNVTSEDAIIEHVVADDERDDESVRKSDRWLTAFVCLGQLYEFTRTAFGMKNAGQTFVRVMQQILYPMHGIADSFVDDCAVSSDVCSEHIVHLDSYLSTIQREGITLNLKKCQFAKPKVTFCGKIIGSGTRQPDPEKVSAIKEIVVPENKKQLRGILELFSYFRKCVPAVVWRVVVWPWWSLK